MVPYARECPDSSNHIFLNACTDEYKCSNLSRETEKVVQFFFSLNEGTLIIIFFEVFVFCFLLFDCLFHHRFVPSAVAARFGELIHGEDSFVCLHLLEKSK